MEVCGEVEVVERWTKVVSFVLRLLFACSKKSSGHETMNRVCVMRRRCSGQWTGQYEQRLT